ncbi:MAG: hypothetical protein AMXMBFR33_40070 [Candidatus Xenobia bacterium]
MGGDKPERLVLGKSLLEHARDLLRPHCDKLIVVGGEYGLSDEQPGLGPLGGLLTALNRADTAWVLVATVDMPAVRPSLLERLVNVRQVDDRAVLVHVPFSYPDLAAGQDTMLLGPQPEPFPGLYRSDLGPELRQFLEAGERKARKFAHLLQARLVEAHSDELEGMLCNVNRPEDLAAAEHLLRQR